MAEKTAFDKLLVLFLLVSLTDMLGAALPAVYQPQHTSSNYRHSRITTNDDFHLASILIPKQERKITHESQEIYSRRRRSLHSAASQPTASGSNRHRHSQNKSYQRAYDKLKAKNHTEEYAKVYMEGDLLPRYECPVGKWACPKPNKYQHVLCINESQVCDYHVDCAKALDEDPLFCAGYRESRQLKATNVALQQTIDELTNMLTQQSERSDYHSCKIDNLKRQLSTHSHISVNKINRVKLSSPPPCHVDQF